MNAHAKLAGIIFGLIGLLPLAAQAQGGVLITDKGPGAPNGSGGNNTVGYDFTVGASALLITSLGLWDRDGDGFNAAHQVGLWDNTGTLLASISISAGPVDPLIGEFRFVDLPTPVLLAAGNTYVLGVEFPVLTDNVITNLSPNQATFDAYVTPGNFRYLTNNGFAYPSIVYGPGAYVGPNAQFTAVPEPSTSAELAGVVALGIVLIRRRRKQAA